MFLANRIHALQADDPVVISFARFLGYRRVKGERWLQKSLAAWPVTPATVIPVPLAEYRRLQSQEKSKPAEADEPQEGGWIQTHSGRQVRPMALTPEDVCIEDIAHSLSLLCRYNGHCREHYSVGRHSILVSQLVAPEHALWGLLHDGAEAYLCDIPRPLKPFLKGYEDLEEKVLKTIAQKYRLPWPMPDAVREADARILVNEHRDCMAVTDIPWPLDALPPYAMEILPLEPALTELVFLQRFAQLSREASGTLSPKMPFPPVPQCAGNPDPRNEKQS